MAPPGKTGQAGAIDGLASYGINHHYGDIERAQEWAKLAYKSDSHFFPTLLVLAWVQAMRGELKEAQTCLDEAARLYPRLGPAYVSGFMGEGIVAQMRQAGLVFARA